MKPDQIDAITAKFGSQQALAAAIGINQSTVSYWKVRGGIPSRQIQRILAAAREKNIALSPADFFEAA